MRHVRPRKAAAARRRAPRHAQPAAPGRDHPLLDLERAAGNAAVARLFANVSVQRQPVAAPEAPSTHRILKVGMTGLDVELAQAKLFVAVGGEVPPDNVFEAKTEDMVKRFQAQKGLGVDGQIGGHTWAALTATTAGRAPADEAELQLFLDRKTGADTLRRGGEFAAAEAVYLDLYNQREIGAFLRHGITFSLGTVVQAQGRFDEATGFYQEFIDLGAADPIAPLDAAPTHPRMPAQTTPRPTRKHHQPTSPRQPPRHRGAGPPAVARWGCRGVDVELAQAKLYRGGRRSRCRSRGNVFEAEDRGHRSSASRPSRASAVDGQIGATPGRR